jgi:hypothetical protein
MAQGQQQSSAGNANTFYAWDITTGRIENAIYVKSRMGQEVTTALCGRRAENLSKDEKS